MPTVIHFEIPADDVERAKRFYSGLFGWKVEKVPGLDDYWFITTGAEGDLGGGMMKRQTRGQAITNYVGVDSIDDYLEKIVTLGGRVLAGKSAVPGMGYYAVCLDPEGNAFGLWQDDMGAK